MSLYREYLEKYEKSYVEVSEKLRSGNLEHGGFYLLKDYIWIAMDYLEEEGIIENRKRSKNICRIKTDSPKLTEILFELENQKEYMMLDAILRFFDDLDTVNKRESNSEFDECLFVNTGIKSGYTTSSFYQALFALKSYGAN